jgi:putative inorganic carbon (HCO3(-)) transporter
MGAVKKRSLLIVVAVVLIGWQTLLPVSVVDRIAMTESTSGEIEGSAAHRLDLWKHALKLFKESPVFGIGFGGFEFTVPEGELTDTHNFYMKTLSEQGVIGMIALSLVLLMALRSGWQLLRIGGSPFHKGLGFGFIVAVIACIISNLFGDRWSYFPLGGYFWIFWGLVDRGILISRKAVPSHDSKPIDETISK